MLKAGRFSLAGSLAASFRLFAGATAVAAASGTSVTAGGDVPHNNTVRRELSSGIVRDFYVTAELVEWNYAPTGEDRIKGGKLLDNPEVALFVEDTDSFIGQKYMKSLFKEYTDDTYTTKKKKTEWAGNLGPVIRAEVGDTIMVHFKNMLPSLPASMYPHGVLNTPEGEEASWRPNAQMGSAVLPGEGFVYQWFAREDSGPTGNDRSNLWFYHGHAEPVQDICSGLLGPLIIYEQGMLDEHGLPTDVDEEFVVVFLVSDENQSHYMQTNIDKYGGDPEHPDFEQSNMMHSLNGFVYGNLPGLVMTEGDTVRWHVAAYGTEGTVSVRSATSRWTRPKCLLLPSRSVTRNRRSKHQVDSLNTAHRHGDNHMFEDKVVDTLELLPSTFLTATMTPGAVGDWLFHCRVNDHTLAGMQAYYTVLPRTST